MNFEVISLQKLKDFDLGQEFISEVIQAYVEEIPQYISSAELGIANNEKDDVRRILHTLKSHSKTLGMEEVYKKLAFWEAEILKVPMADFTDDFNFIKERWSRAVEELKSLKSLDVL